MMSRETWRRAWTSLARPQSYRAWLLVVIGASALCRAAVLVLFWSSWVWQSGRHHDSWNLIAINLVESGTFGFEPGEPSLLRTPVFPLVEAVLYLGFGEQYSLWSVALLLLDVGTTVLVVVVFRRCWGQRAALLAGLFHALHVPTAYYVAQIEQFSVVLPLVVLWIGLLTRFERAARPGAALAVGVGLASGLLALNKSVYMVFPLVAVPLAVVGWRTGTRHAGRWRAGALALTVATLTVAPWIQRNYRVSEGRLLPVQLLTWYNFWADVFWDELDSERGTQRGHRELADHIRTRSRELLEAEGPVPPHLTGAQRELFEEDAYARAGKRWLAENPAALPGRVVKNAWQFWIGAENRRKTLMFAVMQALYLGVALSGAGILLRRRRLREVRFALLAVLLLWAQYSLVYAMGRFSLDLVPALGLLAGRGADLLGNGAAPGKNGAPTASVPTE